MTQNDPKNKQISQNSFCLPPPLRKVNIFAVVIVFWFGLYLRRVCTYVRTYPPPVKYIGRPESDGDEQIVPRLGILGAI